VRGITRLRRLTGRTESTPIAAAAHQTDRAVRAVRRASARDHEGRRVQTEMLARIEHLSAQIAQGSHPRRNKGVDQAVQITLRLQYEALIAAGRPLPAFGDVEARFYSQNGEDGIILMLLAAVGTDTKRAVEICAGDGIENNSANLIVNHGWNALLVDGGPDILEAGRTFYADNTETWSAPPTLRQAWITRDTVNDIVREAGFDGDIDLLTVDVDGVDYWIWQALDCVNPRIVVTEFHPWWPGDEAKSVPYSDDFVWQKGSPYVGASLAAMTQLARTKGYRLVGVNRYGFNAFFVRNDLAADVLPEVDPMSVVPHAITVAARVAHPDVDKHHWVDV
jgi:hypothetical protein